MVSWKVLGRYADAENLLAPWRDLVGGNLRLEAVCPPGTQSRSGVYGMSVA